MYSHGQHILSLHRFSLIGRLLAFLFVKWFDLGMGVAALVFSRMGRHIKSF